MAGADVEATPPGGCHHNCRERLCHYYYYYAFQHLRRGAGWLELGSFFAGAADVKGDRNGSRSVQYMSGDRSMRNWKEKKVTFAGDGRRYALRGGAG